MLNAEPDDMDVVILTTAMIENYEAEGRHVIKRYYEDYSSEGYYSFVIAAYLFLSCGINLYI